MTIAALALGDSYTIGEGVPAEGRWPVQLAHALRTEGIEIHDPQILATTGWTTDELAAAMAQTRFSPPYALVTLLIGVNDQYRGRPVEDYRAGFVPLLEEAVELAGQRSDRVLVVSIPDWGVTPFAHESGRDVHAIALQLDAYNAAAHEETRRAGAHWVDVTVESRLCGADADMLTDDGLHPSAAQYERWTRLILPWARLALTGERD